MHKKYLKKSKLISQEISNFHKNFNQLEKLIQKNYSGQLYMDSYGLETESTQAIDDKISNHNHSSNNYIMNGLTQNDDFYEEIKLKKSNEFKKMINKIDLSSNPIKKNYTNKEDDKNYKNNNFDNDEQNNLKYNLNPESCNNSNTINKRNLNNVKGYNSDKNTEKTVKFNLDASLTVINEKDSSSEKMLETGEKIYRKISDEKKNKNKNLNNLKRDKQLNSNKFANEGRTPLRNKLEKCK